MVPIVAIAKPLDWPSLLGNTDILSDNIFNHITILRLEITPYIYRKAAFPVAHSRRYNKKHNTNNGGENNLIFL